MAYDGASSSYSDGMPLIKLPPIGKLDAELARQFFNQQLAYFNPMRRRDLALMRRSELMDQGRQHLRPYGILGDSSGNYGGWVDDYFSPDDPMFVPQVTYNKGLVARQNESARLARPNYKVRVRPHQRDAAINYREAAKITERMEEDALLKTGWAHIKDIRAYRNPVHGGYWIKGFWEQTYDKTTRVPRQGAQECSSPDCDFTSATPTLSSKTMAQRPGSTFLNMAPNSIETQPADATFKLKSCPQCGMSGIDSPLQPNALGMDEARSGPTDTFGQKLYTDEPLGQARLALASPYDVFPRDMGVRLNWGQQAEWTECHIETLDWVALRYPAKAHLVKAENPGTLAAFHPLTAVPISMGYPGAYGASGLYLFRDSTRVKEYHKAPWMEWISADPNRPDSPDGRYEFNQGRSVVMASDVVLLDGPYLLNSLTHPDRTVPRIQMEYVPWEIQDGGERLQGLSLWQILYDPQIILNDTISQTAAVRQRCAVPTIIVSKQHELELMKNPGIPGRLVSINVDSDSPSMRPELMQGTNMTIDSGVANERDNASSAINELASDAEVEQGSVPPGVTAAIAISQLKNYTGERREPRINRMKESDQRLFRYLAELLQAFTIEPREVRYETVTGAEAWAMYEGIDMGDQLDIEIEAIPDFEEEAETRQIVADAVNSKMIDPLGPKARIIAKLQKLPEEIYASESAQEDTAQNEWLRFREKSRVPRVDPMLDDHAIHLEQHGKDLMSGEGQEYEEAGDWDNTLKALGMNWEVISNMAMMQPPMPGQDLQDTILSLWNMALTQLQQVGAWQPEGDPAAIQSILEWRAHMETHRLYAQQQQMQALAGPMPAAPGGNADAAGNQISPASPNPDEPVGTFVNTGISGGGPQ